MIKIEHGLVEAHAPSLVDGDGVRHSYRKLRALDLFACS